MYKGLQDKHGKKLVGHILKYIIASKYGLSSTEIEDIISCNEEILGLDGDNIFEWWNPPVRRLPTLLWKRLREDLGRYMVDRGVDGVVVHNLYHRQFWETATLLFMNTPEERKKAAQHLASFFNGDFSSPNTVPYQYIEKNTGKEVSKSEDRLISPQPLQFGEEKYNRRKLAELPYHQLHSQEFARLHSSLFSFEFIQAKCCAGRLEELQEDYSLAMSFSLTNDNAFDEENKQINSFKRFINRVSHLLREYPIAVLQLALNEPNTSPIYKAAMSQKARNAFFSNKVMSLVIFCFFCIVNC